MTETGEPRTVMDRLEPLLDELDEVIARIREAAKEVSDGGQSAS